MSEVAARIAENLADIRGRIAAAASRSGRPAEAITLVAVTKYVPLDIVVQLVEVGCRDLGESRPQSLWVKAAELGSAGVRWHMIGHLQRNKIRRTLPHLSLIHSLDSRRLLAALEEEAAAIDRRVPMLVEVNISGDMSKTGLPPRELPSLLEAAAACPHVSIRGLMGMATLTGGEEEARRDFVRLRELRDRLRVNCPRGVSLDELSMGMSGDFEVAIEEGATIVRVGSALFEGLHL